MSKKHDGWVIKSFMGRNPWLIYGFFEETRSKVIERYDDMFGVGCWKAQRKRGALKIVKVKLVEVE